MDRSTAKRILIIGWMTFIAATASPSEAQTVVPQPQNAEETTMLPHPQTTAWWLSGQINVIDQSHGAFTSPYAGPNSLRATPERATSRVWTIFTGYRVSQHIDVLFDLESAGGRGISDALGLAGFTNLDVVRNPDLGSAPYVARLMVHATIPLGRETVSVAPSPFSLASDQPARRIEIRAGKLSLADFFDVNAVGGDSHLQFMNWTIDNNGAYDYAADTRGYTYATIVEYDAPRWSLRAAEALMPTVANGITLDWDLARARADNLELELHPMSGLTLRALAYANHADMGSYPDAIEAFLSGVDARPDITAHRQQGRVKDGVGGNAEYVSAAGVRFFGRTGWNEGNNESFAYTEVNNTVAAGGDVAGAAWHRAHDRAGVAVVSNGLSGEHQEYLRLGGLGFLLGDGNLRYGRENTVETYYTAHIWRGLSASADGQYIAHPGYNQDRGPLLVTSLRAHIEF